jgi:relaxase-like protein
MRDMKKRMIDSRSEKPLLDIVSYGRAYRPLTPVQRAFVARTAGHVPEVMVKVSGGARTLRGVQTHLSYIGRDGVLGVELDDGSRLDGDNFEKSIALDWDLDLDIHGQPNARSIRGRPKPSKLVHNIIFSMPAGTPPDKLLKAVRNLAANEFALKHRYAFTLHTDDSHPHVHLVVRAVGEQGMRIASRNFVTQCLSSDVTGEAGSCRF